LKCFISCSFQKTKHYHCTLTLVGRLAGAIVSSVLLYETRAQSLLTKNRHSTRVTYAIRIGYRIDRAREVDLTRLWKIPRARMPLKFFP
jgi:hypothetical protein